MSYSRWGGSRWFTFWAGQDQSTENRDSAYFEISMIAAFTAGELRADIEGCLTDAATKEGKGCLPDDATERLRGYLGKALKVSDAERDELRGYMKEFLADINRCYPEEPQ